MNELKDVNLTEQKKKKKKQETHIVISKLILTVVLEHRPEDVQITVWQISSQELQSCEHLKPICIIRHSSWAEEAIVTPKYEKHYGELT